MIVYYVPEWLYNIMLFSMGFGWILSILLFYFYWKRKIDGIRRQLEIAKKQAGEK